MSKKNIRLAIVTAIGASFLAAGAASPVANAADNPFSLTPLSEGYQVAAKEGSCGEGKCGGKKKGKKMKSGHCGAKKGEAHCGGGKKSKKEGKCGEGKCGGK